MSQQVARVTQFLRLSVTHNVMLPINLQGQILPSIKMHPQPALSRLDSGFMVDNNQVKAHLRQSPGSNRDNIHVLQSPYGTTQISFRPGFT
jgi:hypothetical protein